MNKPHYVIVTQRPQFKKMVQNLLSQESLPYNVSVATINNHIFDLESPWLKEEGLYGVRNLPTVVLHGKELDSRYRIHTNNSWEICGEEMTRIIQEEGCTYLVDTTPLTEVGRMSFEYMVESLHLENIPVVHISEFEKEGIHISLAGITECLASLAALETDFDKE